VEAHEDAKVRMTMAGAKPINGSAVGAEWAPEYASREAAAVSSQRLGSGALGLDYVLAQVAAGVVPLPESISTPAPAGSDGRKR
jgi:hypothetical protein